MTRRAYCKEWAEEKTIGLVGGQVVGLGVGDFDHFPNLHIEESGPASTVKTFGQ